MPRITPASSGILKGWRRFLLLGPPGVGKGTYGKILSQLLQIPHVSMGDLLRSEVSRNTFIGKEVATMLSLGQIVPREIALEVLKANLANPTNSLYAHGYILDGFPRAVDQVELLIEAGLCSARNSLQSSDLNLDGALELTLPLPVLIQKIQGRLICENCGAGYNVNDVRGPYFDDVSQSMVHVDIPALRPLDPAASRCNLPCGGLLKRRSDDTESVGVARYQTYVEGATDIAKACQTTLLSRGLGSEGHFPIVRQVLRQGVSETSSTLAELFGHPTKQAAL